MRGEDGCSCMVLYVNHMQVMTISLHEHTLHKPFLHCQTMAHMYTWDTIGWTQPVLLLLKHALVAGRKRLAAQAIGVHNAASKVTCLRACRHEVVSCYASYICLLHRALQWLVLEFFSTSNQHMHSADTYGGSIVACTVWWWWWL